MRNRGVIRSRPSPVRMHGSVPIAVPDEALPHDRSRERPARDPRRTGHLLEIDSGGVAVPMKAGCQGANMFVIHDAFSRSTPAGSQTASDQ